MGHNAHQIHLGPGVLQNFLKKINPSLIPEKINITLLLHPSPKGL